MKQNLNIGHGRSVRILPTEEMGFDIIPILTGLDKLREWYNQCDGVHEIQNLNNLMNTI